jgi:hypothetical protein
VNLHKRFTKAYKIKDRGGENYLGMMMGIAAGRSKGGSLEEVDRVLCPVSILCRLGDAGQLEIIAGRDGFQGGRRIQRRSGVCWWRGGGRRARVEQFVEGLVL